VSPRSTSGVLIELFERIQLLSEPAAPY
jgi:hypothetical protein